MKKNLHMLLVLLLLTSCNVPDNSESNTNEDSPSNSETSSPSEISNGNGSNESSSVDTSISNEDSSSEDSSPIVNENPFEGYHELVDGLYVNYLPGVYNEQINVEFKLANPNSSVYYTMDYSIPTTSSTKYNSPIAITKIPSDSIDEFPLTTSVDAILASDTGGKCVSTRYIDNIQKPGNYPMFQKQNVITIKYINEEGTEIVRTLTYLTGEFDIPVVSLSMPYENWFGTENGFYNKIREEIEHRVNVEYFDSEYDEYFYINSQIKLGGNWSIGYPQRTLNLNFNKDENGEKQKLPKTHLFKERKTQDGRETLTSFKRFRLHNGGNCFEEWTGFNDAVLQEMMYGTNTSTTGYRPCIVYCNGEYWGLQYIREHYKDVYYEENYDVDKDYVVSYEYNGNFVFDDGNDDVDPQIFINEMNAYLNSHDFSDNSVYQYFIDNYIDVDSLIDTFIAESYAGNWDFVGNNNNLKLWRVNKVDPSNPYSDGKLRFCLHDVDFAFTDYANFLDKNHANSYSKFTMFAKLLQNDSFKDRFYNRAAELMASNLDYVNAVRTIDGMVADVKDYKYDAMARWGNQAQYNQWIQSINNTYAFFKNKDNNYLSTLKSTLETY